MQCDWYSARTVRRCLVEDEHAVQELAAHRASEAFAHRVHPRSLHGGRHDRGAVCLEDWWGWR